MKIVDVRAEACRLPPSVPWEDATNRVDGLEFVFVEVETDTGIIGTGFTYTVDIGGSAILALVQDYLAPLVIGMDPQDYERIWAKMQRQSRRLGLGVNAMGIAAIDIAVWDILGKLHDRPLYQLIGGARDSIPAYISEIVMKESDTLEDVLGRVDGYLSRGYRAVKIKIGRADIEEDIERITRIQQILGRHGKLFVDLNQKWTAHDARVHAGRLDGLGLGWIEEPLPFTDLDAHVALRRAIRTPIALGESLHSRSQVLAYLQAGAVDYVQADVAFIGGITEWLKIAHLAEIFGKPVAPHYMMELSLQLLCGVPNAFMLENVVGGSFTELGLLEEPIEPQDAVGIPPARPGHGIRFDKAALAAVRLDPDRLRRSFTGGSK
ncbi:mandelate racemase/muconate lactonizing enzyme family protein [Paracoccus sp. CPCC 101403]|uniref:Mandelate racemase/muconate lactonizing enzyme family protein n=1 Tax=Paracoccus broussonetiae TaxID=3075834 RepID=A0ABU3E9P9_9RHOB|nr:mandelate racemase/muconate lactonizing enzyme family protein [Paracoccus sp. CPCC 101403]MDT1060943.1 mandelate racemase/muconate lactonizing enzyme family protein [Paracoccus sp. CPCC 101403]